MNKPETVEEMQGPLRTSSGDFEYYALKYILD